MVCVGNIKIDDKYLKSLKEGERDRLMEYLVPLPEEEVKLIYETGEQFHKSSAVNGIWFWRVLPDMGRKLPPEVFQVWLEEGGRICRSDWECVLSYLKASPELAKQAGPETFLNWVFAGRTLLRYSSREANWYFKNSEYILGLLEPAEQELLTGWILKLTDKSWPAVTACLKAWPDLAGRLDIKEKEAILETGYRIAGDMPDDTGEFFAAAPELIEITGAEVLAGWVEAAYLLKDCRRGVAGRYFASSPAVAERSGSKVTGEIFRRWADLGRSITLNNSIAGEAFFASTPEVLRNLDWSGMNNWVGIIGQVIEEYSGEGASEFIRITPELLQQLDIEELLEWVRYGLKTIKGEKRLSYFTLKSQESRDAVTRLRSGLFLDPVKKVLLIYYEGLTGDRITIRNTLELPRRIHGDDRLFGSLDTRRVYLPDVLKEYEAERDNLRLYRVMLVHQASHMTFGTLDLKMEEMKELGADRDLGLLFEYIEDNRVDYLAMKKHSGLDRDMKLVADTKEEYSGDNLATYLKYYLWLDNAGRVGMCGIGSRMKEAVNEYWDRVVKTEGSSGDSLVLARRLLKLLSEEGTRMHLTGAGKNHVYRGRLRYDLLYTSMDLDRELKDEQGSSNGAGDSSSDGGSGGLKDYEFYAHLRKLLYKFYEDEENPYRMVAFYDEWDRILNDYKKDWCRVREIMLKPSTGRFVTRTLEEHHGMINTLKRYFGMLRPDRVQKYGRREDGEDIDIDAVVEAMIEIKAGVAPEAGFYIRRDKRERDVAVSFLLDLSYSTEEVISQSGKTLLDVETESVIVMSEALEVLGDKYAIYGFNSDSRDKVNFYVVKDFDESYTAEVKQRYGGLKSNGMTRLAAAIRHAAFKMEGVRAAIKILIILSDGRPFDFDYNSGMTRDYEPYYPESDTRMALRETKMKGINPFCITVDSEGQDYLEFIFGNVNYIIIDDVNALSTKLTETYKNLTT